MSSSSVPKTTDVIPGAGVSIVLKADQRTGRQVQGIVRDVLTRGDHHRGIKVRLEDGRIGRVQRMATVGTSPAGLTSQSSSGPESSTTGDTATSGSGLTLISNTGRGPRGSGQRPRYRDFRLDEPDEPPQEHIDLGAYIVAPKRKGKGRKPPPKSQQAEDEAADDIKPGRGQNCDVVSATATCPVCGAFEGDEAAVAHHVSEHFE